MGKPIQFHKIKLLVKESIFILGEASYYNEKGKVTN